MRPNKHNKFNSLFITFVTLLLFFGNSLALSATTWEQIIDYGYAGYSETGISWRTYEHPQSHDGAYRYLSHWDKGVARVGTATWTTTIPYEGLYKVAVSYRQTDNRSPDANFFTTNSSGGMDETIINQQGPLTYVWRTLGEYHYTAGQVVMVLLDGTDDNYSDCADAASWSLLARYFIVTASAGAGGTISPSGAAVATEGGSISFTITPSTNYRIASVVVDGYPVEPVGTFTLSNVTANHTIAASFMAKSVVAPSALLLNRKTKTIR